MADYIEGKRPLIEALKKKIPLKRVLLADNAKRDPLIEDILRKAKRAQVDIAMVSRRSLDEISDHGSHQGVMAETQPFAYVGIGEVIEGALHVATKHHGRALVVVLDHLTDAGNLGAIARSAEVVGAAGLVIPNKRSARVEVSTYKSSAGAIAHIPVAQVANIVQVLSRLKAEGFWVCGASEHAHSRIWDVNLKDKIALVLGNEQEGISPLVQENCDLLARLPIEGEVASLNVAQAATACMYEWLRQNDMTPHA